MNDNSKYLQWIKSLPSQDIQYKEARCPSCNCIGLSYQYFGFSDGNIGWKIVWCPVCLNGIRNSRTKIPDSTQALIGEENQKLFFDQNPNIHLID
jgi:hypothetical protein